MRNDNSRSSAFPWTITIPLLFALFILSFFEVATAVAQQISRDSAAAEQRRLGAELGRRYYFIDRRALSGVDECQIRIAGICIAEHVLEFGTQPVNLWNGIPMPSPEIPPLAGEERILLPQRLEDLALKAPDNGWAIGQLAYLHSYNVGLERTLAMLRDCRGGAGWCTAVQALVLHSYSRFAAADSLFTVALEAMPAADRCRWRDISTLLDEAARSRYQRLSCEAKEAFEDHVWWLSDPLYMMPGNDRRTEHFSRRVIDSLLTGGPSPFSTRDRPASWDATLREIIIRYGMAGHWFVPGKLMTPGDSRDRWVHFHTPNYHFVPERLPQLLSAPIAREDFQLTTPLDSAIERYHPGYDYVADLTHMQTIALPRGDSMLVVAALAPMRELYREAGPFTVALYLARDNTSRSWVRTQHNVSDRTILTATVPRQDMLLGLEAMSERLLVASRTRFTLRAPALFAGASPAGGAGGVSITQPLFYAPAASLPRRAADAIPLMLASQKIIMGSPLGIYWEASGVRPGTNASMTVRVIRGAERSSGFFGRIFGRSRGATARVISWTEPAGLAGGDNAHSVSLDISTLRAGKYLLELEVKTVDGATAKSEREMELIERDVVERDLVVALQQPVPKELYMPPQPPTIRGRPPGMAPPP